jgi:tetratricopeptide (TPR) repeat protein
MNVRELLKKFNDKDNEDWKEDGRALVRDLTQKSFDEVIAWIRKEKYDSERINALGLNIGNKGDIKQAEVLFLNLIEVEKEKNEGRNRNNLAIIYLKEGRFFDGYFELLKAFRYDCTHPPKDKDIHLLPAYQNLIALFVGHRAQVEIDHPTSELQKSEASSKEIGEIKDTLKKLSKAQAKLAFLKPIIKYVPVVIFGWLATILGLLSTGINIQIVWSILSVVIMTITYYIIYLLYSRALSDLNFAKIKMRQYDKLIADGKITID